jgi:hypothetical protein
MTGTSPIIRVSRNSSLSSPFIHLFMFQTAIAYTGKGTFCAFSVNFAASDHFTHPPTTLFLIGLSPRASCNLMCCTSATIRLDFLHIFVSRSCNLVTIPEYNILRLLSFTLEDCIKIKFNSKMCLYVPPALGFKYSEPREFTYDLGSPEILVLFL